MKIKALVSFAGLVNMTVGDIAEVDGLTAADLISAGYAEEVREGKNKKAAKTDEAE